MEEIQAAGLHWPAANFKKYSTGTVVIVFAECAYSFVLVNILVFLLKMLITFSRR